MNQTFEKLKGDASPLLDKVSDQAHKYMKQGRSKFDDASQVVRDKAAQASDVASGYTKDEPFKALLMAAAAGAVLVGLVWLLTPSRD